MGKKVLGARKAFKQAQKNKEIHPIEELKSGVESPGAAWLKYRSIVAIPLASAIAAGANMSGVPWLVTNSENITDILLFAGFVWMCLDQIRSTAKMGL
jgi:hypothetical protein